MAALPVLGAIAGIASGVSGIISATKKPEEPKQPAPGLSPAAISQQRARASAARGRSGTILTGGKLGQVGRPPVVP
jgi:hypothetical protein